MRIVIGDLHPSTSLMISRVRQDGVQVGAAIALLIDLVTQIEQGIVDFADGAKHVLFEQQREVADCSWTASR